MSVCMWGGVECVVAALNLWVITTGTILVWPVMAGDQPAKGLNGVYGIRLLMQPRVVSAESPGQSEAMWVQLFDSKPQMLCHCEVPRGCRIALVSPLILHLLPWPCGRDPICYEIFGFLVLSHCSLFPWGHSVCSGLVP